MNKWNLRLSWVDNNNLYENLKGYLIIYYGDCTIFMGWLWKNKFCGDKELKKQRKHCNHKEFVTRYPLHEQMGNKGSRVSAEKPYAHRCFKECKKCGLIMDTWLE